MANTATALHTVPGRSGKPGPIRYYSIVIDIVDTDLTVYTPASDLLVYVVGMGLSEGTAANITFTSGTTAIWVAELAANQGILVPVTEGDFVFATEKGKALKVKSSAAISSMLLQIVEAGQY